MLRRKERLRLQIKSKQSQEQLLTFSPKVALASPFGVWLGPLEDPPGVPLLVWEWEVLWT